MRDLKEFYEKYNLNHDYCGQVIGVGSKSLIKYSNGEKLRESTKKRIEFGIDVIERFNLVRPSLPAGFYGSHIWKYREWNRENREYMRKTRELVEKERVSS